MNHKSLSDSVGATASQSTTVFVTAAGLAACAAIVALSVRQVPLWLAGIVAATCLAGASVVLIKRTNLFSSAEANSDPDSLSSSKYIVPIEPPPSPRNFEGREGQLRLIHDFFTSDSAGEPAVAVITGAPGIGKTALATRYASLNRHSFPDGQLYAKLEHLAGSGSPVYELLGQFLMALQTADDLIPRKLAARTAKYRSLAADRRLLVIIDNACHPDCVRSLLPEGRRSAAIVISRSPVDWLSGAPHIELRQLSPDEGIRLLESSVGAGMVESNQAAGRLAATGHPLAIRLAATALTRRPDWSLDQALADPSEPIRAETAVEDNLDLIYGLLAPEERRALRCVALLDQPEFAAWELAALLGVDESQAVKLADNLAHVDLVHRTNGGQVGIVEFAVDEHILPYLRERMPGGQAERLRTVARVRAARRQHQTPVVLQLNQTIGELRESGCLAEAFEAARSAVAYAHENRQSGLEALALATIADLRLEIGNIAGAYELAKAAESLDPSDPGPVRALRCLGSIMSRQNNLAAAHDFLGRALVEVQRVPDMVEQARILMEQASVFAVLPDLRQRSIPTADEAVELSRGREDLATLVPTALYARSKALLACGEPAEARIGLDMALAVVSGTQPLVRAWIDGLYSQVMLELGKADAAITWSTDAIDRFGAISHRYGVACSRLTLGAAYAAYSGDRLDEAVAAVSDALETLQNCEDPYVELKAKRMLADLLVRRGKAHHHRTDIQEADRIFEDLDDEVSRQKLQAELIADPPSSRRRPSHLSSASRLRIG
jgi:tetratricopeptide (TPR) repeat protein